MPLASDHSPGFQITNNKIIRTYLIQIRLFLWNLYFTQMTNLINQERISLVFCFLKYATDDMSTTLTCDRICYPGTNGNDLSSPLSFVLVTSTLPQEVLMINFLLFLSQAQEEIVLSVGEKGK